MDGDLLSTGRDWELPGLASSAMDLQLKEVFGSDEDEEDSFPLSRGVLEEGGGASQFLFSSIDESLDVLNTTDQSDCLPISDEKTPLVAKPIQDDAVVMSEEGTTKTKDTVEKEDDKAGPIRQSARLRSRFGPNWLSGSLQRKPLKGQEERMESPPQDKAAEAMDAVKSETDTATEDEEEMEVRDSQVFTTHESSVGEEEHSDETMESGEESDDPDKLWCVCQQPHNDRFMICCDLCSEWYHGECVGISLAEGKRMEKLGVEYICTKCEEHQKEAKVSRSRDRSLRQERRAQLKDKRIADIKKRIDDGSDSTDTKLFVPDHAHSKEGIVQSKDNLTRCIGPGCAAMATKPSIYCGDACIERHVERTLKKLSDRGVSIQQTTASDYVKGAGGVTVFEPATRKILTGLAAPGRKLLVPWIKAHPSYKVFLSSVKGLQQRVRKRSEEEAGSGSPVKSRSGSLQMDTEGVRAHAKRAFNQALLTRCKSADDLIHLTEEEITKIADDIEVKLYNVHSQEVTSRYRNRLRSLLFNLKDTKNKGLFRKVALGEITTKEFVRMSAEQLASEELTHWRETTIKKELKMIKEVAEEEVHLSSSQPIRKMTYKGEVEIEQPPSTEVPTDKSLEAADSTSLPPPPKPPLVLPIVTTPTILNPLTNTTSLHSSHIFDQNCDICLGKAPLPDKEKTTPSSETKPLSVSVAPIDSDSGSAPYSEDDSITAVATTTTAQPTVTSSTTSPLPQQPLWKGYISMHGMETFLTSAYAVSGKTDMLEQVLPEILQVVGRIAHVQVWDYLDKIKSSSSKVIAVIRFECLDRVKTERASYITMLDYFMEKHRYGVFQTGFGGGVKDMYLVPLSYDDPVPLPIQPFSGPGLPPNRRNMFLGVITCSTKDSSRSTAAGAAALKGKRYHDTVHFSGAPKQKKPKVVGFGGATPPLSNEQSSPSPDLSSPVVNSTLSTTKVSFYGDHTEIKQENSDEDGSSNISQSGIKSILSQLSDDKLQELASAMSSITGPAEETKGLSDSAPEEQVISQPRTMTLDERISATLGKLVPSQSSSSQNDQSQLHDQDTSSQRNSSAPVPPTVTPSQQPDYPPTVTPSQQPDYPPTIAPSQQPDYPPTIAPSQQNYSHPPTVTPSQQPNYGHLPTVTPSQQPDYGHPPSNNHHPPPPPDQPQGSSQYPYPQSGPSPPYNQDGYYQQQRRDDYYQQHPGYQEPHGYQYEGRPYDQEGPWERNEHWGRGRGSGRGYYDDWDRQPPPQDWNRGGEGGAQQSCYRWNPDYHRRGAWSKR